MIKWRPIRTKVCMGNPRADLINIRARAYLTSTNVPTISSRVTLRTVPQCRLSCFIMFSLQQSHNLEKRKVEGVPSSSYPITHRPIKTGGSLM
jgi:hypothetical protein